MIGRIGTVHVQSKMLLNKRAIEQVSTASRPMKCDPSRERNSLRGKAVHTKGHLSQYR